MTNNDSFLEDSVCIYHALKGQLVEYSGQVLTPQIIDKLSCQMTETLIGLLFEEENFHMTASLISFLAQKKVKSRELNY